MYVEVSVQFKDGRIKKRSFIRACKWNQYHSWPTQGGLRHLIFNEKKNGFDACVIRVGRRVLIDEEKFFEWARNHGKGD